MFSLVRYIDDALALELGPQCIQVLVDAEVPGDDPAAGSGQWHLERWQEPGTHQRAVDVVKAVHRRQGHEPGFPAVVTERVAVETSQRLEQLRVRAVTAPQQGFLGVRVAGPTGGAQQVRDGLARKEVP